MVESHEVGDGELLVANESHVEGEEREMLRMD